MSPRTLDARPDRVNDHTRPSTADSTSSADVEEVLSLLADEHAQAIIETISDEALPARTIATELDISRATVYRRLNRLEEAGLVTSAMTYRSDGRHRQRFRATFEEVRLAIDGGEIALAELT
ncbi:MAG: ArsR/SmtB family transcription factor [Salinarchaeum sp.]